MEPLIVDHQEIDTRGGLPASGVGPAEGHVELPGTPTYPPAGADPPADAPAAASTAPPSAPARAPGSVTRTVVAPGGWRLIETIWLFLGTVLALLTLDFIFRAAGAHDIGFADAVYRIGSALASPFAGIFNPTITRDGHVYQWADVLAVAVYTLMGLGTAAAVRIFTARR